MIHVLNYHQLFLETFFRMMSVNLTRGSVVRIQFTGLSSITVSLCRIDPTFLYLNKKPQVLPTFLKSTRRNYTTRKALNNAATFRKPQTNTQTITLQNNDEINTKPRSLNAHFSLRQICNTAKVILCCKAISHSICTYHWLCYAKYNPSSAVLLGLHHLRL